MRSRAPPVADAARRSTRSGRKNRASEQREVLFGYRKAEGADAAAGYLWSASVRSTDLDFSPQKNPNPYPAQLSVKGVCKGESLVPLCPVLLPFAGAKGRPPRRAVLTMPLQKAPPRRQATTNSPSIRTTNPSYTSPIKPIIYQILTQYFPIL